MTVWNLEVRLFKRRFQNIADFQLLVKKNGVFPIYIIKSAYVSIVCPAHDFALQPVHQDMDIVHDDVAAGD